MENKSLSIICEIRKLVFVEIFRAFHIFFYFRFILFFRRWCCYLSILAGNIFILAEKIIINLIARNFDSKVK